MGLDDAVYRVSGEYVRVWGFRGVRVLAVLILLRVLFCCGCTAFFCMVQVFVCLAGASVLFLFAVGAGQHRCLKRTKSRY